MGMTVKLNGNTDITGNKYNETSGSLLRGSLSIEAALVLPLFLFFLMTMMSSLQLLNFSQKLQQVLYQEGLYLSQIAYDKGSATVGDIEEAVHNYFMKNSYTGASSKQMGSKSSDSVDFPVEGGIYGMDFGMSELSDPELTQITVRYTAKLTFDPFNLFSRTCCQYVTFHNWIGYVHGLDGNSGSHEEVYVYITEDSEVYHRDRNCTHIKLKITEVSGSEVKNLRNEYGEKYVSCSHCKAKLKDGRLYITKDGNCYHNSLECSGLSRSVTAIPLSSVGNRRPCSRCGQ